MKHRRPPPELFAVLQVIATHAERVGVEIALVGPRALYAWGSDEPAETIDIIATDDPTTERITRIEADADVGPMLAQLRWAVRRDHYADAFDATIDNGLDLDGWPVPIPGPEYLGMLMLIERDTKTNERLTKLIAEGVIEPDRFRWTVDDQLGPYALDDADRIIADAEWLAMTGKYNTGDNVH